MERTLPDHGPSPRVRQRSPRRFGRARPDPRRLHAEDAEPTPETITPAVSLLPADLLQPGEIIILMIKPSLWYIVLESLRFLAVMMLGVAALAAASRYELLNSQRRDLALLATGIVSARLLWQFFDWLGQVYVLTDRRIISVQGIARLHLFEAQLKQIQHTNLHYSFRENLFGLGTITFNTAGTATTEAAWRMVANPTEVHQKVVRAIERYR